MSHTGVAAAKAVGRARGIGTVDVYIATEAGLPDADLLEEVQLDLQERREIAVDVKAKAPETEDVDVTVKLAVRSDLAFSDVQDEVEEALAGFFSGRRLGQALLRAELGDLIYHIDGVENYQILSPAADLPADLTVLPVLGTLSVTQMEDGGDV